MISTKKKAFFEKSLLGRAKKAFFPLRYFLSSGKNGLGKHLVALVNFFHLDNIAISRRKQILLVIEN
jgi:hypothetical protein